MRKKSLENQEIRVMYREKFMIWMMHGSSNIWLKTHDILGILGFIIFYDKLQKL